MRRLTAPWRDRIRHNAKVVRVRRENGGVTVTTAQGAVQRFDRVVLACHGDQALSLLADPTADESRLLREFHYQANVATLHTDASVMPRARLAWSAWNYTIARDPAGRIAPAHPLLDEPPAGGLRPPGLFCLDQRRRTPRPGKGPQDHPYEHPLFSLGAVQAQAELPALNAAARGRTETYFAGAWQRYGFHEDGLLSAERLGELLLRRDPWAA